MQSVVKLYENITHKERHKCGFAFELYSPHEDSLTK